MSDSIIIFIYLCECGYLNPMLVKLIFVSERNLFWQFITNHYTTIPVSYQCRIVLFIVPLDMANSIKASMNYVNASHRVHPIMINIECWKI